MQKLTSDQKAVIVAMIQNATPLDNDATATPVTSKQREVWLNMVSQVSVAQTCECGTCPSIELAIDGVRVPWGPGVVLSARDPEQGSVVLLHFHGDQLRELEIAPVSSNVVTLPNPNVLVFTD